jgi:hypothetical protein
MGHFDYLPKCFIPVRIRGFMATIAIHLIFRRMPKPHHIPGLYPVTFPAFAAKEPAVNIGMTLCALELAAKKRMIRP